MATILLLKYNNYYNRIVKKESTLSNYRKYQLGNDIEGVNFIPNDFINTEQIINWNYADPDYLIVLDKNNNIESRWFIISTIRTREGQLKLELHRDLIVDYYNSVINAPCFIEKATVSDDDPAIYNNEDMTFNQILTSSIQLKDKTNCPWLVGYVARNASTFSNLKIDYETDLVADYTASSQSGLPFAKYLNKTYTNFADIAIDVLFLNSGSTSEATFNSFNRYGEAPLPAKPKAYTGTTGFGWVTEGTSSENREGYFAEILNLKNKTNLRTANIKTGETGGFISIPTYTYANQYFTPYIKNVIASTTWDTIEAQVKSYTGNSAANEINQYVNKIAKVGSRYYRVKLRTLSADSSYGAPISGSNIPVIDQIIRDAYNTAISNYARDYSNLATGMSSSASGGTNSNNIVCDIRTSASTTVQLYLEEITQTKVSAKLNTNASHVHLSDAPYDMFCMPYSDNLDIIAKDGNSTVTIRSDKILAFATMNAIARQGVGAGKIHDIQLLPFCPLQQYIRADGKLDLTLASSGTQSQNGHYFITDSTGVAKLGVFIYCDKSIDSFEINYNIPVTDYKIQSQCDMYRLCSPNYSSIFEFNAAYNRGVEKFNIDFAYKPYTPYIHVNPNFKETGLYGLDRDEPRGLVCGGDFSITLVSDAWETYQLQNKNYQLSFQRQIENMEVNNAVQREREVWGIASGTLGAAASGAVAGGMAGGGIGAGIGAIVGGTASLAGGIRDRQLNEKLRNEALDYTKDMFGYNLQNIKALPNTIAKVGAFNPNNKIFPVLEYYTCTNTEKQALRDKIKYNGMTVMRISTISNFIKLEKTYIKGKLIRLETIEEDFHIINAIADEIYKGVFI